MSNELDKLAAEMRKIKSSKQSRKNAMEAAMSAFGQEFAPEAKAAALNTSAENSIENKNLENNLDSAQGLVDDPRPTGQTTRETRVQTFGRQTMSKFNQLINFKPQTMMMAGTCAAALMAGFIFVPNIMDTASTRGAAQPVVVEIASAETSTDLAKVADGARIQEAARDSKVAPNFEGDSNNAATPEIVTTSRAETALQIETTPTKIDAPKPKLVQLANGHVLEEHPAEYKIETRQNFLVKGSSSTQTVQVPPTFEMIVETVVVQPETTKYVIIPATYKVVDGVVEGSATEYRITPAEFETISEEVVASEGSSEIRTEPAIYNPDGSVFKSAVARAVPPHSVTRTEPRRVLKTPAAVEAFEVPYVSRDGKTRVVDEPAKVIEEIVPAITKEVSHRVIKDPATTQLFEQVIPDRVVKQALVRVETSPAKFILRDEKGALIREFDTREAFDTYQANLAPFALAENTIETPSIAGPKTITRTRRVVKTPARTVERSIPAKTSTITRRVVKTPASTSERSVPAVTKTETRRVQNEDGTFKTVTETIVVQEASTEFVSIPPVFENVQETVVVQEASTELITVPATFDTITETVEINADGTETVIASDVTQAAAAPEALPVPTPQGGIGSVNSLLNDVRQNAAQVESENSARVQTFRQRANQPSAKLILPQNTPSRGSSTATKPLPKTLGGLTVDEVTTETVANNSNIRGQFTVFNGVSNQVVQSTETIVNQSGEILCRVLIPAKYKTITKQVIVRPARSKEITIPAVTKDVVVKLANDDGTFREVIKKIVVEEERIDYEIIPAEYETRSERVLVEPAREEWKPDTQALNAQAFKPKVVVKTSKIYLRDDDGNVVREFASRDAFEFYKSNVPTPVKETPVSTFSVDVDTSSYSFLRASIQRGQLPPRSAIRLEEMINYFPYDYDAPTSADEPFKANVTVTPSPWNADTKLMHIGIKGYVPTEVEKPRNNLVFLIDTSGSMNRQNKLPLLINSFKLLLNTLDKDDTVSIVAYASASGTVLEPTEVRNKSEILAALDNLRAGGSTAGAAGLELAYKNAEENFDDEGNNRVILATDGDFNVGFSSPDDMKTFITEKRDKGISLSVLGFGMGNYNDHLMQSLAQNGNGVAAYIDSLAEAQKVLANEAGSSLLTIAKDVKIQVEFNPATVAEYRLIGYETRALKRQDFNNDKVDAGDIGAGHSVTAIYEMTPVGSPAISVDTLRYVAETPQADTGSDEYAFVKIRHKLPKAETSTLQTFPVGPRRETSLKRASDDMRFAAAVSIVGQKLRGDVQVEDYSYGDAIKLAVKAKGEDEHGYRAEFIQMVRLIDGLGE